MRTRRTRIAALVTGCAVVAGGGYAAADALSGSAPAAASDSTPDSTPAAALSSAVNGASLSAASTPAKGRRRGALAGLRRLPGQYGQYTYQTRKGQRALAFERGTIASVSSKTVTVRAADGHAESWTLTGTSAVREAGRKTQASALADGQKILVAGPVSGSARDARVIVIRGKSAASSARKSAATTAS